MNEHETAARIRKALRMAEAFGPWIEKGTKGLIKPDSYAAAATLMSDGAWRQVAALAGVKPPSEETKAIVCVLLERQPEIDDPLEGLPQ